jgi:hypothetical protein
MPRAKEGKEISVKLGDKIGTGASLFGELKSAGINVIASCCYQIGGEALFTIVVEDPPRAVAVLDENGFASTQEDVLLVEITNEVGALASLLQEISKLQVNVTSAYVTTGAAKVSVAVVKTSNNAKVTESLNRLA